MGNCVGRGRDFPETVAGQPEALPEAPREAPQRPPVISPNELPASDLGRNGRNGYKFSEVYKGNNDLIGEGGFGDVFLCAHRNNHYDLSDLVVKRTKPSNLDTRTGTISIHTYDDVERYCQEIKTLALLCQKDGYHHHVVRLYEFFWTGRRIYMVMERLEINMIHWIREHEPFTERTARTVCRTLLQAIQFLHDNGVCHRDLKPANILFKDCGDSSSLKLVDFGLAKILRSGRTTNEYCGTPGCIPPEMYHQEPYRFETDMFSFGVLLFRLLSGEKPFPPSDPRRLRRKVLNLEYRVDQGRWAGISRPAKSLVRSLLTVKQDRLSVQGALRHVWFARDDGEQSVIQTASMLVPGEDERAVTHAPTISEESGYIWIEPSLFYALQRLMAQKSYAGEAVPNDRTSTDLCRVKEVAPPGAIPVSQFIVQLPQFTECECRKLFIEIVKAVQMFHGAHVAHRNLLIDNILVMSNYTVVLSGIRHAQTFSEEGQPLTGNFGRVYDFYAFSAPEIDSDFAHDARVDLFSLGAILYTILCGIPPFRDAGDQLVINKMTGQIPFDIVDPSYEAQQLVRGLLKVNPNERLSLDEIFEQDWMKVSDIELQTYDLSFAKETFQHW